MTESIPNPALPQKRKGVIRKIIFATTGLAGTFFIGSTFLAFYNQPYYDFFSDHIPLGQSMLEFAESHNWDTLTTQKIIDSIQNGVIAIKRVVTDTVNHTPSAHDAVETLKRGAEVTNEEAKAAVVNVLSKTKPREVQKDVDKAPKHTLIVKTQVKVSEDLAELVQKAERALAGHSSVPGPTSTIPQYATPSTESIPHPVKNETVTRELASHIYEAPLPVGFEPPPGFTRPSPPKKVTQESPKPDVGVPVTFPLVAPTVLSLSASEPIISHLAGTIDNLASYLASNPSTASKVTDVLETAKGDLTALAERIEKAKHEERAVLEAKLDEQTREYSVKLMELEMMAQDKLDNQEEDFRKFFDEEKAKFVQAYRAKLEHELQTQTELINER